MAAIWDPDVLIWAAFVGVLSDCFFDPATALCLTGKTTPQAPPSPRAVPTVAQTPSSPLVIARSGHRPPQTPRRYCARSVCPSCNARRPVMTSTISRGSQRNRHPGG
jgi:hypothetical protein